MKRSLATAGSLASGILLLLVGGWVSAQTLSPGELSRAHESLEGLSNCTKCHVAAGRLSAGRCLECHREIRTRLEGGQGWHGRLSAADKENCANCHPEHQGRDAPLIDWGAGIASFDHRKTGYVLQGAHAKAACDKCHAPANIKAPDIRALLAAQPKGKTWLGLSPACSSCHADQHRGQLGLECERCHTSSAFVPASGFDHGKTAYPLSGKHARVACDQCHPTVTDTARGGTYVRYRGIAHALCTDCHRDPHDGKLGKACESCHSTNGFMQLLPAAQTDVRFHDKTNYPLKGAHAHVPCRDCHGPFAKAKAVYKGLAHSLCTDCHVDGHFGQLDPAYASSLGAGKPNQQRAAIVPTAVVPECDRCHDVNGFLPPRFEVEQHASTRFPLDGSHAAVACSRCHKHEPALIASSRTALEQARERGRAVNVNDVKLRFTEPLDRCETCHRDPHAGQFASWDARGGCKSCHNPTSFTTVSFNHQRDSGFPLTGKHASTPCASCHLKEAGGVVRYRPLSSACDDCHADEHWGQLATPDGRTDCSRCHDTAAFAPALFNHDEPRFSSFPLTGKHATVACERCHPVVAASAQVSTRRYAVPARCEQCHVDVHQGAFAGGVVLRGARATTASKAATIRQSPKGDGQPTSVPADSPPVGCDRCHSPADWFAVTYDHSQTGFPLRGRHQDARCRECHRENLGVALATECSACHRDAHAGEFGQRCAGCHEERSWNPLFSADAHRRTVFPLVGRHAILPCTECHRQRRDRGFGRAFVDCVECHATDYASTAVRSIDHQAAGFSLRCQDCHQSWSFAKARFPQHEACFSLTSGPHGGISCRQCHSSLPSPVTTVGQCATGTAACTSCHTHSCGRTDSEHNGVPGYQCKDRKCYECHRFTR